jgi:hypothetical protein
MLVVVVLDQQQQEPLADGLLPGSAQQRIHLRFPPHPPRWGSAWELIRNIPPLGPYTRRMPRSPWWS